MYTRALLIGATLLTLGAAAAPASAQIYLGAGPGGVGVGVGDPYYNNAYRHRAWREGYASDCRVVRERIVTPSGRRIIRERQICD